jgi:hypothetical protein
VPVRDQPVGVQLVGNLRDLLLHRLARGRHVRVVQKIGKDEIAFPLVLRDLRLGETSAGAAPLLTGRHDTFPFPRPRRAPRCLEKSGTIKGHCRTET